MSWSWPLRPIAATVALLAIVVSACGRAPQSPDPSSSVSTPSSSASQPASTPSATVPTSWSDLTGKPAWVLRNQAGIAADPAAGQNLAFCGAGTVQVSRDGGATWTSVSTGGVVAATAASAYPILAMGGAKAPSCSAAVADPSAAKTVYAVFDAGPANAGMPPVFHIAAFTTDGGTTWKAVPAPQGYNVGGFGGYFVAGKAVQALFGSPVGASSPQGPAVLQTSDGGKTWAAGTLSCVAGGPCLTWGPAPSGTGSCAMHPYAQPVERSADGGKTWTEAPAPANAPMPLLANGCALNELVAVNASTALLIAATPPGNGPLVQATVDNGTTWKAVTIPDLPSGSNALGLQMLADGSLLTTGSGSGADNSSPLLLLTPGASQWCTVPGVTLSGLYTSASSLQPVGGKLFWVQNGGQANAKATSVPLSSVHC